MSISVKILLQQATQLARQLLSSLENEKQALASADWQQLTTAQQEKKPLLDALEKLNQQHQEVIKNLDNLIAEEPKSQQNLLQKQHQQMRETIKQCQHQNQVNEVAVRVSRQNNQSILNILQGKGDILNLYSDSGQTTANHISNYDIEV